MSKVSTRGTEILLGNPKKAIVKLAIPMIIAMGVQTLYNIVDAIWVSGISQQALAGIGFYFPFLMVSVALSVGFGTGGGAALARRIGRQDRHGASGVASLTIFIIVGLSLIFSIVFLSLSEPIFSALGAGQSLADTLSYANVMFAGSILFFFSNGANSILRSEGDANRAMLAMVIGAFLNIVLDPFFIYSPEDVLFFGLKLPFGLNLGVAGAAYATLLSMAVSSALLFYWLILEKKTYVKIRLGELSDPAYLKDILRVGVPASLTQLSISLMMVFITFILTFLAHDQSIAVFTTGWRIVMIAILPLVGMATAVISVSGAAYGAGEFQKLNIANVHAYKIGFLLEMVIAILTFIFAPQITSIFTWSEGTAHLKEPIIEFLRIACFFFPAFMGSEVSAAMFQGTGRGKSALLITLLRTIILIIPSIALFAFVFNMGVKGVYFGILTANWIAGIVGFIWARSYVLNLQRKGKYNFENKNR